MEVLENAELVLGKILIGFSTRQIGEKVGFVLGKKEGSFWQVL